MATPEQSRALAQAYSIGESKAMAEEHTSPVDGGSTNNISDSISGISLNDTDQVQIKSKSLLDLPPELRSHIYDHLFASLNPRDKAYPDSPAAIIFPGLMRTSSVLRKEATPQYGEHLVDLQRELPMAIVGGRVWIAQNEAEVAQQRNFGNLIKAFKVSSEILAEKVKAAKESVQIMGTACDRIKAVLEAL